VQRSINGYLVFYQDQQFGNAADPGCHRAFALSENGDQVYLSSAQGDVDLWPTEADDSGLSLSRKASSAYGNDISNWKTASSRICTPFLISWGIAKRSQ
jgi:hypothetical protein